MKKALCLVLAAVLFFSVSAAPVPAEAAENELTILAYICGSDLESDDGQATEDIAEMISSGIGASGTVKVLIATGGCTEWKRYGISSRSVQYYRLGANAPELLKDVGRRNMGDASTLADFLRFALSAAPAKRYMMVFWDHGGGPVLGLCNDQNFQDDSLSLSELKTGLQSGLNGTRFDLIGFDCCLMNCVDLCADLAGIANYAVVSQELVNGTGLNYDAWMKPIVDNPALSSETIAKSIADTYVEENSRGHFSATSTMTVVDTGKMPAVMDAANAFSAALSAELSSNFSGVVRLRQQLVSFGEFADYDASDLVDVEDMCTVFSALLPNECAALKDAAQQAVCYNCTTGDIASHAHGLSFFLPFATVASDKSEILSHYSAELGSYAALAVSMANQTAASGYAMTASSYTPFDFYSTSGYGGSCSGAFCDIWNGYYGDTCSFQDAYNSCGGNIWAGLNTSSGSIWEGLSTSSGIWAGYNNGPSATPSVSGIWAGLGSESTPPAAATPAPVSASAALNNIWAGLLNPGAEYYQPGEPNQNVQAGVSEAVPAESVLETASDYFSSATLTSQMVYSIQLNKNDLDHLSSASGILSIRNGEETVRLGNLGETTIDWSTGLIFSMFDGSWPVLDGQMVRAEILYGDDNGNVRFVIPARIGGLKMYLLGSLSSDGTTAILGATQGYDEAGFAIRGFIPLEAGMSIAPLFTAVSSDGTEREYEGKAITVPAEGLSLRWETIPAGNYQYCFGLTDLSGRIHYTDSVPLAF
ncbi:MAG: hypothetical protein IJG94_06300 [Clostridia bacterium]|nr:hypothetical protein [Clostridia bacterium]